MSKIQDIVGQTYTNKNNRTFKVLEYKGRDKKGAAYKHYYDIQFLVSKNQYIADRTQIKNLTCRDLDIIALENKLKKEKQRKDRARLVNKKQEYPLKKFDFKDKIVLGLDLSTNLSAWCASKNGIILKYGAIAFKNTLTKKRELELSQFPEIQLEEKQQDFRERIYKITKYLDIYIKASDIILIEDTFLQTNAKIYAVLSELRGFVLSRCFFNNKEFEILKAGNWRKAHNFVGITRDELKQEAINRFEAITGIKYLIDDVPEAYFISTAGEKIMQKED